MTFKARLISGCMLSGSSALLMSALSTGTAMAQADIFQVDGFDDQIIVNPGDVQPPQDITINSGGLPESVPIIDPQTEFPVEQLEPDGQIASNDELYAQQLLGLDGASDPSGAIAPQGVSAATAFTRLTRTEIEANRDGVYFIDSSDGTYHPELAQCSKVDGAETPTYNCDHVAVGQFYAQINQDGTAVEVDLIDGLGGAAAFSAGGATGSVGSGSFTPAPKQGFSFQPYFAARGIYSLAGDLEGDGQGTVTEPEAGYGGALSAGTQVYRAGNLALRAEAEAGYRTYAVPDSNSMGDDGTMSHLTLMANIFADYNISDKIVAYVGGGAGMAQTSVSAVDYSGSADVTDEGWSLAYQGIIGGGYKITPSITAFAEYRRLQVQKALNSDWAGVDTDNSWGSNEAAVGIRIALGGF